MSELRSRLRLLVVLGLVIGGGIAFYLSSNHPAPTMSYRLADPHTLVITAGAGAATWTRVVRVAETDDDVRVVVESLDWPVLRTMQLTFVEFTIVLSHDLGERVVRDGSGSVVPRVDAVIGLYGGQAVLGISNGTTLTVTLFVNGDAVTTATPGSAVAPIVFASLPPLPWTVEARSASGRVLTSMDVEPGSVWATAYPDGHAGTSGAFGRVDLSCGRLTIWAGYDQPSGPPPPSPAGSPGDCAP